MKNFSVSLWLPGVTERYSEQGETPLEAAKKALKKHENSINQRLKGATGKYKRDLEACKVPRLVEVFEPSTGRLLEKFNAREV